MKKVHGIPYGNSLVKKKVNCLRWEKQNEGKKVLRNFLSSEIYILAKKNAVPNRIELIE